MKQFSKVNGLGYHVDGQYVPSIDRYSIDISSTYSESKNPTEHQNICKMILSYEDLTTLCRELVNISKS